MRKLILAFLLAMTSASAESQTLIFSQILTRPELKTTQPNHKIAYGKDALQYGELWLPPTPSKNCTAGGRADSRRLLARGFAGAGVGRLSIG